MQESSLNIALPATLRYARRTAGLTQTALAEKMGLARTAVCKWERGATLPTLASLESIGTALGIPAWKLLRFAQKRVLDGKGRGLSA